MNCYIVIERIVSVPRQTPPLLVFCDYVFKIRESSFEQSHKFHFSRFKPVGINNFLQLNHDSNQSNLSHTKYLVKLGGETPRFGLYSAPVLLFRDSVNMYSMFSPVQYLAFGHICLMLLTVLDSNPAMEETINIIQELYFTFSLQ